MTRSSLPWASASAPSVASASAWSPKASTGPQPQAATAPAGQDQDQGGRRTESWSNWLAAIRPKAAATGPCNCWPTNWSSSAWSSRSAPRRCARRSKKRHPAVDRRDLVHPAQGRCRVRLADGGRDPDLPAALRSEVAGGLLRRGVQATVRRGAAANAASTGPAGRVDYEYERKGVCHQLMMCEPLRGWRHVKVTERRTRRDYAQCLRELVDVHYPEGDEDPAGAGQPEHARRGEPVRGVPAGERRGGCWTRSSCITRPSTAVG